MSKIKAVYLQANLSITNSFSASNVIFPSQFQIVEQDNGSVHLYPLEDSPKKEMHVIPNTNIACITYDEVKKPVGRPKGCK